MKYIKKIIIILLMSIVIVVIKNNCVFAADYSGTKGTEKVAELGMQAVGSTLNFGQFQLQENGGNLSNCQTYCVQHSRKLTNQLQTFYIGSYIELDSVNGSHRAVYMQNGQVVDGGFFTHYHEKVQDDAKKTKILATLLAGLSEEAKGYGYINDNTARQKAIWKFFAVNKDWVSMNLSDGYVETDYKEDGGDELYAKAVNAVEKGTGFKGIVKMTCLTILNKEDYQNILIVTYESAELEDSELVIEKIDGETYKNLPGVKFIIQNAETGEYVSSAKNEGNNTYRVEGYSKSESDAMAFATGITKYMKIIIKNLKVGTKTEESEGGVYNIIEKSNPNKDYILLTVPRKVVIYPGTTTEVTIKNFKEEEEPPNPDNGEGNVTISGTVWEDLFTGKQNSNNSKKDSGEKGIPNVRVRWKTSGGTTIASTLTNSAGKYEMKTNINIGTHVYRLSKADWEKVNNSYIEFEYNGLKYTTVATGSENSSNVSKAIEWENDRIKLDSKFTEVTKDEVKDSGIKLSYKSTETNKSELEQIVDDKVYYSDFKVRADTKSIVDKLMEDHASSKSSSVCIEHCYYNNNPNITYSNWLADDKGTPFTGTGIITNVDHNANHSLYGGVYCCGHQHKYKRRVSYTKADGSTGYRTYTYYRDCDAGHKTCDEVGHPACLKTSSRPNEWKISNMDLGLVRREQPDLALTSDIDQVRVIMKNQVYTYKYNSRGIAVDNTDGNLFDYKVKFQNKYSTTYRRPVNPSDIAYVVANGTEELQVYVKYKIIAKNQSNTLPVMVKEIVNYYDSNYTIVSPNWQNTSRYGKTYSLNGYKAAYTQQLDGSMIEPGKTSKIVEMEFRVNDNVVKQLIDGKDVLLNNVSEIHTYASFYGSDTMCSEHEIAKTKGWTNNQYAGIDLDSRAGSAVPGDKDTYEDDTDQAPTFVLFKDPNYKIISGTVYEDTSITSDGQRRGNGYDDGENKIKNVKVELLRILDDGSTELAKIYRVDGSSPSAHDAVTYTNESGEYDFTGIVVDNYIIRYTYGNRVTSSTIVDASDNIDKSVLNNATTINGHEINARNYKSTVITAEPAKSTMKGNGNDQWHLITPDGASVAVDNLEKRKAIESLQYSNFNTPINMTAYTSPFRVQVEYTEGQVNDVETDGITIKDTGVQFDHKWPMFDFAIIERPREDIVVDKTIENMKITLANGQVLTEGSPYTEKLNYVKALGTKDVSTRAQALNAHEKFLYIEMDSELIQGARLDILYKITVTNNSEVDYEYDYIYNDIVQGKNYITTSRNSYYYYYGEVTTPIISTTVDWVVEYMDPELTCLVGDEISRDDITGANVQKYTYQETNPQVESTNTSKIKGEDILLGENANYRWIQVKPDYDANKKPTKSPAQKLYESGLISETTKNTLEERNYWIFKTNYFYDVARGTSKSLNIFASKLLANQAEDYTYENHVEILQLNDKIARNIDSVKRDGTQSSKYYKTGNYVPSLSRIGTTSNRTLEQAGLHEQDDDMITIRITPPTGLENNTIIYISAGLVGLLVVAGGIYFIKKKIIG